MSHLGPADWHTLLRVFEADGFHLQRTRGDHMALVKPGMLRPVVIPRYREISVDLIMANLRTAGISRERYLELLRA